MKKLVLSLALVAVASLAFGQKKVVKEAEKGFKSGNLQAALVAIDSASRNPETENDPATYLLKAKIYTKMFGTDSTNTKETLNSGYEAINSFKKTFQMVDSSRTSPIGKSIFAIDDQFIPENLKPYSINSLKTFTVVKGIERFENDDYELSYEFFNLALEIDYSDTAMHMNAAILAQNLDRTDDVKKHFNYLINVPNYGNKENVYIQLVEIFLRGEKDEKEEGLKLVNKALEEYPNSKILGEQQIVIYLLLEKMDEAQKSIEKALESDPNNPQILSRSAYLKEKRGDLYGALAEFKKGIELDPTNYQMNLGIGFLLYDICKKSISELNTSNQLSDSEWEKREKEVKKETTDFFNQSLVYLNKALELKAGDIQILYTLYDINARLNNTEKVKELDAQISAILGADWKDK
jgi:tetratricopeptide (TPR) repeat protein